MIRVGNLDLRTVSDIELHRVSNIMKQNGRQLLAFSEAIAKEQQRRINARL